MARRFDDVGFAGVRDEIAVVVGPNTGGIAELALAVCGYKTGHRIHRFGRGSGPLQSQPDQLHADQLWTVGLGHPGG